MAPPLLSVRCHYTLIRVNSFNLQISDEGNVQVVSVGGYLGRDQCYRVQQELSRLMRQRTWAVIVDCSRLSCITNTSLTHLNLWVQDFQRQGGQFRLAGLSRAARCNAELAGFETTALVADLATARKTLNDPTALKTKNNAKKN